MSTTAIRPVAQMAASDEDARLAEYRARVDILRRTYRRRASRNGVVANCLSLLLVATGAAVGLSPISDPKVTAGLGVTVILLEGIARVMKPALRAAGARRASRKLDREFRLYDAYGSDYRYGSAKGDAAFILAVERVLAQADASEERDDSGATAEPPTRSKAAA